MRLIYEIEPDVGTMSRNLKRLNRGSYHLVPTISPRLDKIGPLSHATSVQ